MPWRLLAHRQVQVNEGDYDVNTHIDVRRGDTLIFPRGEVSGQVFGLRILMVPKAGAGATTILSSRFQGPTHSSCWETR